MTKENVINAFKNILSKSGMDEVISLSENTNEIADIMIYQEPGKPEYLAVYEEPLFPLYVITNILYKYGEDYIYNYEDTELQFVIELDNHNKYVIEYGGGDLTGLLFLNGKWITGRTDIEAALKEYYNGKTTKRDNLQTLFESMAATIDEGYYDLHDKEAKEICKAVDSYIKENPADTAFVFSFLYTALKMLVYSEIDIFDINHIIRKLLQENLEDNFIEYIREYECNPDDYRDNIGYVNLATTALRLIREVKEETASV